ncbi:hypothetical protein C5C29_06030 [Rathayibacter sp. AY1H2]|nr:hypothetical protein C5C29_06030 [Rathayibacter sp. AY1H2]
MKAYVEKAIAGELGRLDAMKKGATVDPADYEGEPWDATTFAVLCNLIEIAKAPWANYTTDHAYQDAFSRAPRDEGFTDAVFRQKWESALQKITAAEPRPLPDLREFHEGGLVMDFPDFEGDDLDGFLDDDGEEDAFAHLDASTRREVERALARRNAQRAILDYDRAGTVPLADRVLTRGEIASMKPTKALVEGVLDLGSIALLYGPSGIGKSFFLLWIAVHVAAGKRWGLKKTRKRRVLLVLAEGAAGIGKRIAAQEKAWHLALADDELRVLPVGVDMSDDSAVDDLAAIVEAHEIDFVIIETLNTTAGDLEENSSTAMGRYVGAMRRIKRNRPDAVVLVSHHSGLNGKLRGSSALFAAMDTVISLSGEPTGFTATVEKSKDGARGHLGNFKLVSSSDSMIVEGITFSQRDAASDATGDERALASLKARHGAIGTTRAQWIKDAVEDGLSLRTAQRATAKLIESGRVTLTGSRVTPAPSTDERNAS